MRDSIRLIVGAKVQFESMDDLQEPVEGSILALERPLTSRYPIDAIAVAHQVRAVDNLQQVFGLMVDEENFEMKAYPYALYSLIRTTIEAAATALWVLQSSRKSTRVFRGLQLAYRDVQDQLEFNQYVLDENRVQGVRQYTETVIARLIELKDAVGDLRQKELGRPPRYTAILASVSKRSGGPKVSATYSLNSPLIVWKISSAFIHGNEQVTRNLSDVKQVTDFRGGMANFEVTPSFRVIAQSVQSCVALLAELEERYRYLATHNYAGRRVDAEPGATD
ncbi:hypothetical protein SAMN06295974_3712 [Plantibacter flavus]|uniref:Uncharacterized protein n=1 Tax=Plantibacter flavus TaxID=150123 RepID=A0A3N2BLK0_9MICO|nr:hypothetical protein [Plantibacter flavus]ROR76140.1 hypothetical protein EDD42_4093 [Plantibacter flavus]SMG48310.1 hypothetical protein SAMN06295974_3712 [Plantibacter flavus]